MTEKLSGRGVLFQTQPHWPAWPGPLVAFIMKIYLLLVDFKFQALGGPFWVRTSDDIYDLKKKVKEERQNDLAHVDPARLIVWKTRGKITIDDLISKPLAEILANVEELRTQRVVDLALSDDQILLVQLPGTSCITTAS